MNCRNSSASLLKRTSRWFYGALLGSSLLWTGAANAQVTTNGGSGLAATYGDLASAITALNAATITSPVVITLDAGNPQTAPQGGYTITASGTAVNTIEIFGSTNTITAPSPQSGSGALTDAIFKIVGGDWITIANFTMVENPANTTTAAGTNNMTEWGVALLKASSTDGAQNCTIQDNSITLNRAYQNTFGIYSSVQHSATSVSIGAYPSSPAGSNSGLALTGNTITNVNTGICVNGGNVVANYDNGLGITNNTITNFGTTGTFSSFNGVSGTVNGIQITNQLNATIDNNAITSSVGGMTASGTMRGIFYRQSVAPTTVTSTSSISGNSISLQPGQLAVTIVGIEDGTGSTNTSADMTLNINGNDFHTTGHTTPTASGTITFINNGLAELNVDINDNTFTDMTVKTTGSVTFILNSQTRRAGAVTNANDNAVVTQFTKTGSGGTVTFYNSSSTTPSTAFETNTGNNFSNITLAGSASIAGWICDDGLTSAPYGTVKVISFNTFSNITGGTGTISVLTTGYSTTNATSVVSGNTISNISGGGTITGITLIQGAHNVTGNTVTGMSTTGTTVTGIQSTSAGTQNINNNSICDLQASNSSGAVNGILIVGVVTSSVANVYNNTIGDLRTPITNQVNNLRGINITALTGIVNVHFNTVSLNASSTGTNFGSSAFYSWHTPLVTSRNNIFSNTSTSNGTGYTVAFFWNNASGLANYQVSSDRNLYNVSAGGLVYYNPTITTNASTLADFQTYLNNARDDNSISEAPDFLSTTCGSSDFLHINPATPTFIESGASTIAGVTTDFDGDTRNVSTPDIGADEFAGSQPANCSGTPSAGTASAATTTLCTGGATALSNPSPDITPGIVYQWYITTTSGSGYTPIAGATTATASSGPLSANIYYILMSTKCTNSSDSALTAEVTVTVNAIPTATATNDGPVCAGGTVTFDGVPSAPGTYAWTGPNGFSSTDEDPSRSGLTTGDAGTYTLTVTVSACPTSAAAITMVEVNSTPVISSTTATPNPTCFNGDSQLNAPSALPNVLITEVLLNRGGSGQGTVPVSMTANDLVELNNASKAPADISGWTVKAYFSNSAVAGHTLTFPAGTIIPANSVAVVGLGTGTDDPALLYFNTGGGGNYNGNANMGVVLQAGDNIVDVVGVNTMVWNPATGVTAADWSGTPLVSAPAGRRRTSSTDNNLTTDWELSSVTPLTIGVFNPGYANPFNASITYLWTPNTYLSADNISNPLATGVATASITYTVTASFAGCSSDNTVTLTTDPLPTVVPSSNSPLNVGNTLNLTAGGSGGTSWVWSGPNGFSSTDENPSIAGVTLAAAGTYTVTSTSGDCNSTEESTEVVISAGVPTVSPSSNSPLCEGSTLNLTAGGADGTSWAWSGPNGFSSTDENPSITSVTTAAAGIYSVTATNANGSSLVGTTTVSIQAAPNAGTGSSVSYCSSSTTNDMALAISGADAGGTWSPAGPNYDATTMSPGAYTYTVDATAPCLGNAQAVVTVSEQAEANAGANGTLLICANASPVDLFASLIGTPDASGSWSGPSTLGGGNLGTFTPGTDAAGVYTYTVNATAPCTGSVDATLTVSYDNTDTDSDGIVDCEDNCPNLAGQIGSACDDGDANTTGDVIDGSCTCAGTPVAGCNNNLFLEFQNASNPGQVTWEVRNETGTVVVEAGSDVFPAYSTGTQTICLADGCYRLSVTDNAGDGITGYELRETGMNGRRIIDNTGNMITGTSAISGGGTFCLPIGDVDLIYSSCDKLDWVNYKYMVCHADAAVAAEWVPSGANSVQDANSGYEFWIFDPNGTYSFRKFHPHNQSQGYSPASANRACRFKINDGYNTVLNPWIPENVKMNVRVRGRVNGVNQSFGPACTMMLNAAAAACPATKLQDDPSNVNDYSCGVTRNFGGANGGANKIVANPPQFVPVVASNQVRYQFRFRIPAEGVCIVRPIQTSPTLYLNWTAASGPQLLASKTYEVEVRASKDQGATWCAGGATPACDPTPATWGKACNVTIGTVVAVQGGSSSMSSTGNGTFNMYPNPNNGDQLFISLTELAPDVNTVSVDIYDLTGKRITARTIAVNEGFLNTNLELNGNLANGLYMVNITAGEKTFIERLVIQK